MTATLETVPLTEIFDLMSASTDDADPRAEHAAERERLIAERDRLSQEAAACDS